MIRSEMTKLAPPEAARKLTRQRFRGILIVFITGLVLGGSTIATVLVYRVFAEFNSAVEADLRWKAVRGAREVATAADVAIALGDVPMVTESFGDYRSGGDIRSVVAVDTKGVVIAKHGKVVTPIAQFFAGKEGDLRQDEDGFSSWVSSRIEGQEVGRVAVVISKDRLKSGYRLRQRFLLLAAAGCVAGILISIFFVNAYIAPLLKFTLQTLDSLTELNETLEQRVSVRTAELSRANGDLAHSLEELNNTQVQLVDASRRAGMADVATTVLHNVGNVLNSVNVSSEMIHEALRTSAGANLDKMAQLLKAQGANVHSFLATDPRGQKVPTFLIALSEAVSKERNRVMHEVESLRDNIDHIKNIITRQQELARVRHGVIEIIPIHTVLDSVIRMVQPSFEKRSIEILGTYTQNPRKVAIDRHKLFEVLMNLLTNARQAVEDQVGPKRVTIIVEYDDETLRIEVQDNGSGIAPENLAHIFEQGFTTKAKGHGFGLHGSACHMIEMGGKLRARSAGSGLGATFVVELPLPAESHEPMGRTTQELVAIRA